jgi:flagellar basal-body rod modification protein FlgD
MTEVTSTSAAAAASAASSKATAAAEEGAIGSIANYDDFLTLLTTQLKNQDPLNPQDSTEFVSQIAQFTGVEQQVSANAKLDQLISLQTGDALASLATWIGQTVTAPNAGFGFDGEAVTFGFPADADATTASVTIRNASGQEVASLPADPTGGEVTWDGKTKSGGQADAGLYYIEYVYGRQTMDGLETWSEAASGVGRVVEARLNNGQAELVLDTGAIIDPSAATSLRESAS